MVNNRTFQISCDIFNGYNQEVDLDYYDSLEDIISYVIEKLQELLIDNKLESLITELKKKKFHIHDISFGDMLINDDNKIYYICSHS